MKRKEISTKRTITSHLNSLKMKKTMTYDDRNPGPGFRQAQTYCGAKPVNEIPIIPLSHGNSCRYKRTIKKT